MTTVQPPFPPPPDVQAGPRGVGTWVRAITGHRSLRFVLAAAANTALGLTFFPLLILVSPFLRVHYMVALVIAQLTCLCFAFATYRLGVFRSRGRIVGEFVRFSSFYLVNYAMNWVALPILVEVVKINPIVAQLGFASILMVGSYFWHSRVTFTRHAPSANSICGRAL